jgi:hypothetical protein
MNGIVFVIIAKCRGYVGPVYVGKQDKAREAPRPVLSLLFSLAVHLARSDSPPRFPISRCLFGLPLLQPKSRSRSPNKRSLNLSAA